MTDSSAHAHAVAGASRTIAPDAGNLHRLLVDAVRDYAIFALDPNGVILTWNAGARRLKGYEPEEIIGRHFSVFYPQHRIEERFPEYELEVAARDGSFEDEGWRIRKDGSRFWANVVITALRDEEGALVGYAKVTRDLTERRRAEEALRFSEERFRLLVQSVTDYAIFMLDPTGRVATWNAGAAKLNGWSAEEIVGRHFSAFYTAEDLARDHPAHELEVATRVGRFEEEGWRLRKDGSRFWANVVITAVRDDAGQLRGFAKVTRDLTERRAAEQRAIAAARRVAAEEAAREAAEHRTQELRALAERLRAQTEELELRSREAEEANRAKGEFLAAMSHELRTPLNAIGGYAELLELGIAGPVTKEQLEHLDRIRRSQQHLLGIINDILNFSRIEAGQVTYEIADVPLAEVVADVTAMVGPQARRKGIRLETAPSAGKLAFEADRAKVEQILVNLLSNAVKFTPDGGRISIEGDARDGFVEVAVRDSGVGIPGERLDEIFEPFVQIGRTLTTMREGTGLGLSISRDLARAMGGDILVESEVDVGSTFTLRLPRARSAR